MNSEEILKWEIIKNYLPVQERCYTHHFIGIMFLSRFLLAFKRERENDLQPCHAMLHVILLCNNYSHLFLESLVRLFSWSAERCAPIQSGIYNRVVEQFIKYCKSSTKVCMQRNGKCKTHLIRLIRYHHINWD